MAKYEPVPFNSANITCKVCTIDFVNCQIKGVAESVRLWRIHHANETKRGIQVANLAEAAFAEDFDQLEVVELVFTEFGLALDRRLALERRQAVLFALGTFCFIRRFRRVVTGS